MPYRNIELNTGCFTFKDEDGNEYSFALKGITKPHIEEHCENAIIYGGYNQPIGRVATEGSYEFSCEATSVEITLLKQMFDVETEQEKKEEAYSENEFVDLIMGAEQ